MFSPAKNVPENRVSVSGAIDQSRLYMREGDTEWRQREWSSREIPGRFRCDRYSRIHAGMQGEGPSSPGLTLSRVGREFKMGTAALCSEVRNTPICARRSVVSLKREAMLDARLGLPEPWIAGPCQRRNSYLRREFGSRETRSGLS